MIKDIYGIMIAVKNLEEAVYVRVRGHAVQACLT